MKVRAVFGNPYRESLLRTAFDQGKRTRLRDQALPRIVSVGDRFWFAFRAGYVGHGWHRSPNGQVKWHKGGA